MPWCYYDTRISAVGLWQLCFGNFHLLEVKVGGYKSHFLKFPGGCAWFWFCRGTISSNQLHSATAAKLSSVVTTVKCECYIKGRVIEVLLSCYLCLLAYLIAKPGNKTAAPPLPDPYSVFPWPWFWKKKKKKPWENGGMEEVAFAIPHQLSSCVAIFIYYFASRLVVNKPLIFGQPLLEYWQYGPYKAVSVTLGLGTRAQHCLLHANKVFSKCISL